MMMAPFKRQRQPKMTTQALLDFDLGESSSDSDFRIDDFDSDNSKDDDEEGDDRSSATSSSSNDDDDEDEEDDSDKGSEDSTLQLKQLLADASEEIRVDNKHPKKGPKTPEVTNGGDNIEELLRKFDSKPESKPKVPTKPICCVCLGDRSDDTNEIVECDGCGVSVHEGCYGVSDNTSISSTNSTCSTEPWFCEACRAGVSEPSCELCPNKGGIYKETDVGKWVHLVCALYVPGVAFGEVDQLSNVTLFEMQYSKWGAKVCSLCENSRFSRTGVCIGCDAGMCKTFFHVTCAQAAGFLTEAHHEDTDAADPFYAHCKVHSEKELIRKRKRNYHTFRLHMEQKHQEKQLHKMDDPCPAQMRINRKLQKYQLKYAAHKQARPEPWVPTQKMSRLLTTSASACRRLLAKANVMDVDVDLMERQEVQVAAITDIRKKWHIAPAFSVEFVAYYLDRISRTKELKEQLASMMTRNTTLTKEQDTLRTEYDSLLDKNREHKEKHESLLNSITQLQTHITALCPNKNLINPLNIGRPAQQDNFKANTPPARPISVPTAAALKMGVGFPLAHLGHPNTKGDANRLLSTHVKNSPSLPDTHNSPARGMLYSLNNNTAKSPLIAVETHNCGICKRSNDQHLLAKCDTCKLYYHLGCLNPPLTRHPKKSKLYGWQCSECDKSDQSDGVPELPKGPRKSRTRFNKDGIIVPFKSSQNSDDSLNNSTTSSTTRYDYGGAGPTKRRSLDIASSTISPTTSSSVTGTASAAKKLNLNKSLPNTISELSIKLDNCQKLSPSSSGQITPKLSKKSKLSLNYSKSTQQQQQTSISTDSTKTISKNMKHPFEDSHHPPPVQTSISNDEPLVLVMNSKTSTPLPVTTDYDPLALPSNLTASNNATTTNNIKSTSVSEGVPDNSKQARKQKRKDKHRNKHNLSSDTEKSPNKEHKRKRKKKQHDLEAPNDTMAGIPKIKIKFKTLPLPGEVTPEAQFFYVSADMVRSADEASRPGSVETIEDIANFIEEPPATLSKANVTTPRTAASKTSTHSPVAAHTPAKNTPSPRKSSPRKSVPPRTSVGHSGAGGSASRSKTSSQNVNQILTCCVCNETGATSNVVTCDECRKHYHFTCLDPPLKKTPKIRGYSWHCADCDPTDDEKH
ncbi:PHD finger protein 14 [Lucilia sericata]|uniref:PHD finger protein 14 n=1 Tax=Lucilia sericata TaxID=13632 RepID=UPI0018A82409|nr:PHD finger protein 14 [Lucilia sericata]